MQSEPVSGDAEPGAAAPASASSAPRAGPSERRLWLMWLLGPGMLWGNALALADTGQDVGVPITLCVLFPSLAVSFGLFVHALPRKGMKLRMRVELWALMLFWIGLLGAFLSRMFGGEGLSMSGAAYLLICASIQPIIAVVRFVVLGWRRVRRRL